MTKTTNVLVIMTDELRRDVLECYGGRAITPNMDALAAKGRRFDAAYTPSPICVPARASIATGRYVHETGCWANAQPYSGAPESWHHRLREAGHEVTSIGKLHFRSSGDDNGFSEEVNPLHVKDGKGWLHGLLRDREDLFEPSGFSANIGPGSDAYTAYDLAVCSSAVDWLRTRGASDVSKPWCLYTSFLRPHYPLTCPQTYFDLYDPDQLPMPRAPGDEQSHPILAGMKRACNYDKHFDDRSRRIACASYFGLCSFVDDMVGRLVQALEEAGLANSTTIILTSDHGECLGDRGFWTKMVMYEEAAAVPLIVTGPHVAPGVCTEPVSLIDLYPTILDLAGVPRDMDPPHARSLLGSLDAKRSVLSEYHDYGASTGMFMLRRDQWKLVCYPGSPPQLFDLSRDPQEEVDLAPLPDMHEVLGSMTSHLHSILDPEAVNAKALADQAHRIKALGGREAILKMQNFDHTPVA